MIHWRDPAVLTSEDCSSTFFVWLSIYVALLGSCSHQVYARHGRRIYVSYM
jgi:hypothetical protein